LDQLAAWKLGAAASLDAWGSYKPAVATILQQTVSANNSLQKHLAVVLANSISSSK